MTLYWAKLLFEYTLKDVPARSISVGMPEINPVVLFIESPSGRLGAQTSTSPCPLTLGAWEKYSPLVMANSAAP